MEIIFHNFWKKKYWDKSIIGITYHVIGSLTISFFGLGIELIWFRN
jgi:hypothetical protein